MKKEEELGFFQKAEEVDLHLNPLLNQAQGLECLQIFQQSWSKYQHQSVSANSSSPSSLSLLSHWDPTQFLHHPSLQQQYLQLDVLWEGVCLSKHQQKNLQRGQIKIVRVEKAKTQKIKSSRSKFLQQFFWLTHPAQFFFHPFWFPLSNGAATQAILSPLHLSQGLGSLGAWAGLEVGWTEVLWEFDEDTGSRQAKEGVRS